MRMNRLTQKVVPDGPIRLLTLAFTLLLTVAAPAAELKQPTIDAFNRYVQFTEQRFNADLQPGKSFLWIDRLSAQRQSDCERLRNGEVVISRMETLGNGKEIHIPDGMIHHWIGTVFIPGATLQQTLALAQNYDRHDVYYAPDVQRSKLTQRNGDDFQIYYRFKRHKVVTVVLDTNYDIHYARVSPTREISRSYSTRVQEVENAGKSDERDKPVGDDTGFLWRLYTYWRFEQKDGGTYVQCEAISLTRDIPTGLGWMIRPFIESVPRESLEFTLASTRKALVGRSAASLK
jgi:hypothetical protein